MKLNLECGQTDIQNGYTNVNFNPVQLGQLPEGTQFVIGNYKNLDKIVKDQQAEEIRFVPSVNKIKATEVVTVFQNWHKNLAVGGKVVIWFYDIRHLGRAAHVGDLSLQDLHNCILGANNELQMVVDTAAIKAMAKDVGFTLDLISMNNNIVYVELVKNA
jgi:hypothetical protein